MGRDGAPYCIDVYEASRDDAGASTEGVDDMSPPRSLPNRLPWTGLTWEAARNACVSAGKRLCDRDEWVDACDGQVGEAEGLTYTYGDTLDTARCNTSGMAAVAGGSNGTCMSPAGTFDQSGNIWEWTGNEAGVAGTRGGGWRSSRTHECKNDQTLATALTVPSPEVGFRCCRDN